MEVTLNKTSLHYELGLLNTLIPAKPTVPSLQAILIRAQGDSVELVATDLEHTLQCYVRAKVAEEGELAIPAKKLTDIVKQASDKIHIATTDSRAVLKTGRAKYTIPGWTADSYPLNVPDIPLDIHCSADDISKLVKLSSFASATQESLAYTLNGARFEVHADGSARMVATDGHRLACVTIPRFHQEDLDTSLITLLPRKALAALKKLATALPSDKVALGINPNTFKLRFEQDHVFTAIPLTGKFPDYQRVIVRPTEPLLTVKTVDFLTSIKRVALLADLKSQRLQLSYDKGELKILSRNVDAEEAEDVLSLEGATKFNKSFNARYLAEFCEVTPTDTFEFGITPVGSAYFTPVGLTSCNCEYFVMSMADPVNVDS